ncbi:MAG: hypothetical protein HYV06_05860 [Deltaproteobacteria bacterium]|nr:hypothetical protein [Deltaproteobacteria bacterium]
MKFNKKMVVLAAAGALSVATALPAMALENEFHGSYGFKGFLSNFDRAGANNMLSSATTMLKKENQANNYFEQRARLTYIAKANDDLKMVTTFELDTRFGGITDGKYNLSSDAGGLDADGINLETKNVYIDFNIKPVNFKVGIQGYTDKLKGVFAGGADLPGIMTTTKLDALTLGMGYFRFDEAQKTGAVTGRLGGAATDLFALDATYAVSKDVKAGLSYYFLADYKDKDKLLHTLGLNGEAKVGAVTVSGFAAIQAGHQKNAQIVTGTKGNTNFHGFAANVAAKMAVGPGTARTAFLYLSGDDKKDNQQNAWHPLAGLTGSVSMYNEGATMMLVRSSGATGMGNSDDYVRRTLSDVALYTLGYNAKLTPKAYADANVGVAWAAKNSAAPVDKATTKPNATNYIGTEIDVETGYKVFDNLTAKLQLGYLLLGGYYKGAAAGNPTGQAQDPENPYTARVQLTYAF